MRVIRWAWTWVLVIAGYGCGGGPETTFESHSDIAAPDAGMCETGYVTFVGSATVALAYSKAVSPCPTESPATIGQWRCEGPYLDGSWCCAGPAVSLEDADNVCSRGYSQM
jgi:hypothetical protein